MKEKDTVKEGNMDIYISSSARPELKDWLLAQGHTVREFCTEGIVADPLSAHPDMFMCRMGIGEDAELVAYSEDKDECLSPEYPLDIAFNAACTGKYFIHNLRYTAKRLLEKADERGMIFVDVKQGYSKCSTVIVDADSIITYDRGIAASCEKAGLDVLVTEPGHVLLPGYDTGFIGGASGRVSDMIVFNGDLREHPDFERITDFITARGLEVKWFEGWPLTDIGSVI